MATSLCPPVGSAEFNSALAAAGAAFRRAGVGAVVLLHGTFVGDDLLGFSTWLDHLGVPGGNSLRHLTGELVDRLMGETGNYSPEFAARLEEGLNQSPRDESETDGAANEQFVPIRVVRLRWSGENHHLARADGAIRTLMRIRDLALPPGKRVMLWGHSHGGNVMAILSHLCAGDGEKLPRFFTAAEAHYRGWLSGASDIALWDEARQYLTRSVRPLAQWPLDMVTFGTPIRYGWDERGYGKLLHFVHHQPVSDTVPERASWRPGPLGVLRGTGGDYVHLTGVAGMNLLPLLVDVRSVVADHRLGKLFEDGVSPTGRLKRLTAGLRVQDAGTTLLVNYGAPRDPVIRSLWGHAVYTRSHWLPFHLGEIARRFYNP